MVRCLPLAAALLVACRISGEPAPASPRSRSDDATPAGPTVPPPPPPLGDDDGDPSAPLSDTLVLYAYAETSVRARDNLRFFLKHGLLPAAAGVDFVFTLNGPHTIALDAAFGSSAASPSERR